MKGPIGPNYEGLDRPLLWVLLAPTMKGSTDPSSIFNIHIHIKFKTGVKTVKVNREKHAQVYCMYRAV